MSQADEIRAFAVAHVIAPARKRGEAEIAIRAGDIHKAMGLRNAMPAICSAIGSDKFTLTAGVTLVRRHGPSNGANAFFRFALSSSPSADTPPTGLFAAESRLPIVQAPECDLAGALVLISCVKGKRLHPAPARDLYTSPLFTLTRDLVARQGAKWRILSALYGLVDPNAVIEPYDQTLNRLGVEARRAWAAKVMAELRPLAEQTGRVTFFAGFRYREFLIEPLLRLGISVDTPLEHLRQGEQLAWLSAHQ
jgi:hypothetical protein